MLKFINLFATTGDFVIIGFGKKNFAKIINPAALASKKKG
jgi:hypothetical protein